MTRLLLTTALIGASIIPTAALAAPQKTFTRDGESYVYTTEQKPGRIVISGRQLSSGTSFELIVRGDRVSGVSGGTPVSFTVPDAQAKLSGAVTEVASK